MKTKFSMVDFWSAKTYSEVPKNRQICILFCFLGVNFINSLRPHFLYENALRSFFQVAFWLWGKKKSTFVQKTHM